MAKLNYTVLSVSEKINSKIFYYTDHSEMWGYTQTSHASRYDPDENEIRYILNRPGAFQGYNEFIGCFM